MEAIYSFVESHRTLIRHFLRYVACGGTAAVVDIGLLYVFTSIVGIYYLVSAVISYLFGMVTNYTLNKVYTFENKSTRIGTQFLIFSIIAGVGLLLNQLFLLLFVEYVGLWYLYAKVVTVGIVLMWNFVAHRYVTFGIIK